MVDAVSKWNEPKRQLFRMALPVESRINLPVAMQSTTTNLNLSRRDVVRVVPHHAIATPSNDTILAKAILMQNKGGTSRKPHFIKAEAKLYRLGEQEPYFSLTGEIVDAYGECGGQLHDEILKQWPKLKPLADIHLSDDNGIPMHALENGWYWAGGCREWCKDKPGDPPNVAYLASHLRVSLEEAQRRKVSKKEKRS